LEVSVGLNRPIDTRNWGIVLKTQQPRHRKHPKFPLSSIDNSKKTYSE